MLRNWCLNVFLGLRIKDEYMAMMMRWYNNRKEKKLVF